MTAYPEFERQKRGIEQDAEALKLVLAGIEKSCFELIKAVRDGKANEVIKQSGNVTEGVALIRKLIYG